MRGFPHSVPSAVSAASATSPRWDCVYVCSTCTARGRLAGQAGILANSEAGRRAHVSVNVLVYLCRGGTCSPCSWPVRGC